LRTFPGECILEFAEKLENAMLNLLNRSPNGNTNTQEMYRKRLEEVLGGTDENPEGHPDNLGELRDLAGEVAQTNSPHQPGFETPRINKTTGQLELDQVARQIADALVGTLGTAIQDVGRTVAADHSALETAADTLSRLSNEVRDVAYQTGELSSKFETLAHEQSQTGVKLAEMGDRLVLVSRASTRLVSGWTNS